MRKFHVLISRKIEIALPLCTLFSFFSSILKAKNLKNEIRKTLELQIGKGLKKIENTLKFVITFYVFRKKQKPG